MTKTDRDFGSAPLAAAPIRSSPPAAPCRPSDARPCPSPAAGARASLGGYGLSRRRRPLVVRRGRPLVVRRGRPLVPEMEEPPPRFFSNIFPESQADLSWVPEGATPTRTITSASTPSPMTRRLLQQNLSTPTRSITPVQTPSPMTRSRKRMLEFEGSIEPIACEALSPVAFMEKGKAKKLKVVRSKKG
ncbi:unnamed protein product [Urochloa decumbens]|uniref:Uncharacterized protein n=1 Tax=Urochloa decumbens TaxID=240449 RepID=A0ABC9DSG8_9POAL